MRVYILTDQWQHDDDGDRDLRIEGAFESLDDLREYESTMHPIDEHRQREVLIFDTKFPDFFDCGVVRIAHKRSESR